MIKYLDLEFILSRFIKTDARVLEIGSNGKPGYLDNYPNLNIIRTNVRELPGIDQLVDAEVPLPFSDSSFDLVFMVATDYYIQNIDKMFLEISRVLVPGGSFVNATYKFSNLKWQVSMQSEARHAKTWAEYKKSYNEANFSSHYEVISNNEPKNRYKKMLWKITPQFILKIRAQWTIHICKKNLYD